MSKPSDQSMNDLVNAAFNEAAKEVVKRAIETGTPVIVWRDGHIVELDPNQLTLTPSPKTAD